MTPDLTAAPVAPMPGVDVAATTPPPPDAPAVAASPDARRLASVILEVLAGMRSITDAALALGVTAARYYALEARAVAGLIAGCEPRGSGPVTGAGLAAEVERLRAERDRLRDEAARYQALARIAQVAFGPAPTAAALPLGIAGLPGMSVRQQRAARAAARAAAAKAPSAASGARPRKKRVPTVRALRLAQKVQHGTPSPPGTPGAPAGG